MLLFCLVIQSMIKKITAEYDLDLNVWFVDDGTLVGKLSEVRKALDIIAAEGVKVQYTMKPETSKAYWPTISHAKIRLMTDEYPLALQDGAGGLVLMVFPLSSPLFCAAFLDEKMKAVEQSLQETAGIPDARLAYHVHRMTASACRATDLMRVVPLICWRTWPPVLMRAKPTGSPT